MVRLASLRQRPALCIVFALLHFAAGATPSWAQFEMRARHVLYGQAFGVVAADFNHDGKLDIAVIGDHLSILMGNGDGTFQAPVTYPGSGEWIALGDFNGDGNPDLVTTDAANNFSLFLGNADGTFQSPKVVATTGACRFLAVGDFNGDHKLDMVVIDGDSTYISVLLGNGDGTFQSPIDNDSFVGPQAIAVGDFNNDGRPDVAVAGFFGGPSNIGVLLGNGDGTLQSSLSYPVSSTPILVATADFNSDGNTDLAVGFEFGGAAIFLGKGDGSFLPETDPLTYGGSGEIYAGDFNRDGIPDLALAGRGGFSELIGKGDGTFEPPAHFIVGQNTFALGIGDFNGDGLTDVLYVDRDLGITTFLNTSVLNFSPNIPLSFPAAQTVHAISPPVYVKVTNTGSTDVSIRAVKATAQFHATENCEGHIAPGGTCEINAFFDPSAAGPQIGFVAIYDSASSKPQVVQVSGRGTFIALSPNRQEFADQKVGTLSAPQSFTITNQGTMPVTISQMGVGGLGSKNFSISEAADCQNPALAPGATCHLTVTFAPKQTGLLTATIFVHDSGPGSPEIAVIQGIGTH